MFTQFHSILFQTACFTLPISPATTALFIAYLFERNYASSTVNTYLSALSYSHKLAELPDPTQVFYIIQMLKGYGKNRARLDSRLPITLPILQRLIEVSPRLGGSNYQRCQFKAMCSLAFFAFLRIGEMTTTKNSSCQPAFPQWKEKTIYFMAYYPGNLRQLCTVLYMPKHCSSFAFQVAKEVSDRIDGAVAPDGFMKSFVSSTADQLFYWDKHYLTDFMDRNNNMIFPGHNYFSKIERFLENHARIGDKYLEIVKFSCEYNNGSSCSHCAESGWVDAVCHCIPEPMPDYASNKFKYLHVKDTPIEIDEVRRPVNQFNPRVQLKCSFKEGTVNIEDPSTITSFSERYIVP